MQTDDRTTGYESRDSMKVEFNGVCDKGLKRQINQDRLYMKAKENTVLFAIADGMGGHSHGEKASGQIISELRKWYEAFEEKSFSGLFNSMVFSLRCVLEQVNKDIYNMYGGKTVCGSTVVVMFVYCEQYVILWSGDSRAYMQRGWKYKMLTVDDVWENQIEIRKVLTKKQIKDNINYGKLINAIGTSENARINIKTDILKKGSHFLLCSDGLHKMCSEKEIRKMMEGYQGNRMGDRQMQEYLKCVYAQGAKDNVSFILSTFN